MTFHHFGIALRCRDNAVRFLEGNGYSFGRFVYDPAQGVWLTLCRGAGLPTLELVLPGAERGPLKSILRHQESAIYHQAFMTPDAAASLAAMEASGLHVLPVSPPKPTVLFSGVPVSFHYVNGFGLIELIHSDHLNEQ